MGGDWEQHKLEEITDLIVDCPHSTPKWTDSGVTVLRSQNIRNGRLILNNASYTTEDGYLARTKRAVPSPGDLVLTREAPMGEVCIIPEGIRCCMGQRMVLIRVDKSKLKAEFLLYMLQGPYIQNQISWSEGTGTTVSNIRIPHIKGFQIPTPPLRDQKIIANILGTLDDKIELNRQTNQTLEAMAQALFKSWFVDFDPVIDNALAAGNEIPEPLKARAAARQALGDARKPLPEEIRREFPDGFEFVDEMGWVPRGWNIAAIGSLCEMVQNGGTPRKSEPVYWEEGTIPWLTSGEVRQTIVLEAEKRITDLGLKNSSAKWLPAETTLVAMYGATAGQVAITASSLTTNQAICGLIPKKGNSFFNFLFLSENVVNLEKQARGSAQQNISKGIIENMKVVIPSDFLLCEFDVAVRPIFEKWIFGLAANGCLSTLRDTLLPKLLSGQLTILDAEKLASNAL